MAKLGQSGATRLVRLDATLVATIQLQVAKEATREQALEQAHHTLNEAIRRAETDPVIKITRNGDQLLDPSGGK